MTETETARRTKRRYAHELYPHAEEYEVRPLEVEVPYLYARAIGLDTWDTGWHDAPWKTDEWARRAAHGRTGALLDARLQALLADALLQGLAGDEAWAWATQRSWDYEGSWIYERASHYGVDPAQIKPYPCGPEPEHHFHYTEPDARGWRVGTSIEGRESDCPECTDPVESETIAAL